MVVLMGLHAECQQREVEAGQDDRIPDHHVAHCVQHLHPVPRQNSGSSTRFSECRIRKVNDEGLVLTQTRCYATN